MINFEIKETKKDILEIYRLAVDMADKVSFRRSAMNRFYLTLVSALFAVLFVFFQQNGRESTLPWAPFYIWSFGLLVLIIALCYLWILQIQSYKKLNQAKFKVIAEMEKQLPIAIYAEEEKIYKKDKRIDFSDIEIWVPRIFIGVCFVLMFLSIFWTIEPFFQSSILDFLFKH